MRSVRNKLTELNKLLHNNFSPIKIIALTETWLDDSFPSSALGLDDYNIFRKDRGTRGGGIMLATHKNIVANAVPLKCITEILAVDITNVHNTKIRVVISYNPSINNIEYIESLFKTLSECIYSVPVYVVLGDFNMTT